MNIVEPIIKNVFELPDTTALVDLSEGKEHHISFSELGAAVSAAMREIERLGIDTQKCVATNFKDPTLDLVYFVALSALGVGVYPVASFSGIEMVVIDRLGISICVNDIKNVSMPIKSVSVRNNLRNGNIAEHQDFLFYNLKNCSERPWMVRNTSGTTGDPKVFSPAIWMEPVGAGGTKIFSIMSLLVFYRSRWLILELRAKGFFILCVQGGLCSQYHEIFPLQKLSQLSILSK